MSQYRVRAILIVGAGTALRRTAVIRTVLGGDLCGAVSHRRAFEPGGPCVLDRSAMC